MKFMKLGSKPDCFQNDGNNVRYAATELATDVVVHVADVEFYLHKFPLVSRSTRLQKLLSSTDEIHIPDLPGGPAAFEICAKFCYGISINLNAYNIISIRCAAEYLEMHESVEKGNLIYKIDIFLNSTIFRSWKDSIIVLQTMKRFQPLSEDLKLTSRCIEAIAAKASVHVSRVDWSYTYSRKANIEGKTGTDAFLRIRTVPVDWWVEDLCDLDINLYRGVIINIKKKGLVSNEVIGEALKAYAYRKLPNKGVIQHNDVLKLRAILDAIVRLLPFEKGTVSCSFLLKLLKAGISVNLGETTKMELVKRIGQQLEEASVNDLLIQARDGEGTKCDAFIVKKMVEEFAAQDRVVEGETESGILSEASKLMVAKVIDGYLGEIAKDPNLALLLFVGIAELVNRFTRTTHDGLYKAIDTYLKEHPNITKSERKKICRLIDCKKLSPDACMHAVQNERLPLRVVVQVLFFEQVRSASASSGSSTPDLPKPIKDLNYGSYRSSRSATTTNADEDWDVVASAEELRNLRGEVAALRLGNGGSIGEQKGGVGKVKGLNMTKKMLAKMWSTKGSRAENCGSDSPGSVGGDDGKCTPTRSGRGSVS